jgi:NAD(P)-dependent dehydrogenase (short-subunit alcohol dehydrogenase family)
MPNNRSLDGKVAVVTGASRGIGKQVCLALARRGARLVLAARTVEPRERTPGTIEETAAAVRQLGPDPVVVPADLGDQHGIDTLVGTTLDRAGGVDILVNNAGFTVGRAIYTHVPDLPRAQWQKVMDLNVTAPLMLIQGFWDAMRQRGGGRVVNVTSGAAQPEALVPTSDTATGFPPIGPAYGATKAALNRMANSVAVDGYLHHIAIISIEPGLVMTETMHLTQVQAGRVNPDALPPTIPAAAIEYLCTCDDPMRYSGQVLVAAELVAELGLVPQVEPPV